MSSYMYVDIHILQGLKELSHSLFTEATKSSDLD